MSHFERPAEQALPSPQSETSSATAVGDLTPVPVTQRIDAMDVLRGFALIGILMMNIEWFNRPIADLGGFDRTLAGADFAVGWFVRVFIEGKFYKLFSLLFGMGFAVMLLRAQESGRPFTAWFVRRMLALFAFGMIHLVLFWGGDILHDYAFGGLLLLGWILLLRKPKMQRFAGTEKFLRIGLIMSTMPFVVMTVLGVGYGMTHDFSKLNADWEDQQKIEVMSRQPAADATANAGVGLSNPAEPVAASAAVSTAVVTKVDKAGDESGDAAAKTDKEDIDESKLSREERIKYRAEKKREHRLEQEKEAAEETTAFTQTSYWQATVFRAGASLHHLASTPFFGAIILFPLFLLGYWFVASGAMRDPDRFAMLFKSMAWIGMILGLAMSVAGITLNAHPASRASNLINFVGGAMFNLGQYVLAAGYLGVIVVMVQSARWRPRLAGLAPLGRMALTNYLSHSLILTLLFYGYGAGLFGHVPRALQMLIVIAIIVPQIYFSRWWLSRYQFGPMEWLWRSLTYLKIQPMRIATPSAAAMAPT